MFEIVSLFLILALYLLLIYLQKYRFLLTLKREPVPIDKYVEDLTEITPLIDPFLKFPCECKEQVTLEERILPGQAAVLLCDNCKTSWTVYNPSLIVKKTSDLPDDLQQVWAELANEPL